MTNKDVKNLNLALEKLNEINNANIEKWAKLTGLEPDYIFNRLCPILIDKQCILTKQVAHETYDYRINYIGKIYLNENKFKKEYEQEQRSNKEIKLLDWRIKTYWIHWVITILAFGMSAYLFIRSLIK